MIFIKNLISGTLPFSLLMITGIFFTVKSKFCQISRFNESLKLTAKAFKNRNCDNKGVTSFKAACTALSATVGTGNIAGVAGALSIGGAGAVFWMWVSGILGMCIKAAEITLAILYREKENNTFVGGPMYYIKNALPKFKPLAYMFCITAIPAVFCSGNITQVNAAVITFCNSQVSKLIWGIIFAVCCFLSIRKNIEGISSITEKIVPFMSLLYIVFCLTVIIKNHTLIPQTFKMIFMGAFNPKAVTGSAIGSITLCIFTGTSRGIFSNEAGLGTSAMAHSVAVDADIKTQGLYGIFEVFADTILLCTLTALTILCSGVKIKYGILASTELTATALKTVFGNFGNIVLAVMMCLFAFSSIIGWAVYGKLCCSFLFKNKPCRLFDYLYPTICILGAVLNSHFAWELAAICNGIMLCINLFALLLLQHKTIPYLKRGTGIDRKKNIRH